MQAGFKSVPRQTGGKPDHQLKRHKLKQNQWQKKNDRTGKGGGSKQQGIHKKQTVQSDGDRKLHRSYPKPVSDTFENERTVGTTKSEVVLQGDIDLHLPGLVGAVIKIAVRVLIEDVDRRRRNLVMDCQYGK